MNPTPPLASGASNGAGPSANAASTAPQANAAPTDFLALLAQIVGQPAQQAMTPIVATNSGLVAPEAEADVEGLDAEAVEALGMLPISLPMFSSESKLPMSMFGGSMFAGSPTGITSGVQQRAAALDLQMLTDMIASEQVATREGADGLESFQLPSLDAAQSSKATTSAELLARAVHAPVGSSQWADEIGTRLTMMTEQGKSAASLRLSPEHLGPLEIRISMKDDQASVWFGAAHADTRAAIEHALPRLRELFEAQGMSLADAGVFHEAPREQSNGTPASPTLSSEPGALPADEAASAIRMSVGLFDAYA